MSARGYKPRVHSDRDHLVVEWPDGSSRRFHWIWLRDNCRHPSRWTSLTGERTQLTETIPVDVAARDAWIDSDGRIVIAWDDNTADSRFDAEWLWRYRYDDHPPASHGVSVRVWQREYGCEPATFEHDLLWQDPAVLCGMIDAYAATGLVRIRGVPVVHHAVERFTTRLACVREIVFDRVADIRASPEPYNLGFTNSALPLHTDCSGYAWPPNVMAFHCLRNSVRGGEALYADGAHAVRELRRTDPEALRVLRSVAIRHRLYSASADTRHVAPRIVLDADGELAILRYANWTPQPLQPGHFDDVPAFYRAHRQFAAIVNDPGNVAEIRPQPGDLLLVNNQRVLHGRRAFELGQGERHFQQVYMELDDLLSLRRVLMREQDGAAT